MWLPMDHIDVGCYTASVWGYNVTLPKTLDIYWNAAEILSQRPSKKKAKGRRRGIYTVTVCWDQVCGINKGPADTRLSGGGQKSSFTDPYGPFYCIISIKPSSDYSCGCTYFVRTTFWSLHDVYHHPERNQNCMFFVDAVPASCFYPGRASSNSSGYFFWIFLLYSWQRGQFSLKIPEYPWSAPL